MAEARVLALEKERDDLMQADHGDRRALMELAQARKSRDAEFSSLQAVCESLREDLRYDHDHEEVWQPLSVLKRDGWSGHDASFSTMDAQLCVASGHEPEYYNDDQAWGDAIASSVAASLAAHTPVTW